MVQDYQTVEEIRTMYGEVSRRPLVARDRIEFVVEDDGARRPGARRATQVGCVCRELLLRVPFFFLIIAPTCIRDSES